MAVLSSFLPLLALLALQLSSHRTSVVLGQTIPLWRRSPSSVTDIGRHVTRQRGALPAKYSRQSTQNGDSGYNLLVDQLSDSRYYGSLAIGTPPTMFDMKLDTALSDMWVAGAFCKGTLCDQIDTFDSSLSRTFYNTSSRFFLQYGQNTVTGFVGNDVVQMAGFSVGGQGFAVVDDLSQLSLTPPVSGVLGLGWKSLASSGETPFWQNLAGSGVWESPLFAIQLTRYTNISDAQQLEPGGVLTMGLANSSLYSGSIDYVDIPGNPSHWYLPLQSITVQGSSMPLAESSIAIIDTGTTNIGGPANTVQAIYAQIPGSEPATGDWESYYQYPCFTSVNVSFSFGSSVWSMSPADFLVYHLNSSTCIGAFFETTDNSTWYIGDAFLKNVYTVFRYDPPSVGFAALSDVALAENSAGGTIPTATLASNPVDVTVYSVAMPRHALNLSFAITVIFLDVFLLSWTL